MKFSLFRNIKSNQPQTVDYSLHTICLGLTTPVKSVAEKSKLPLWSPTIFNGTRSGANSISLSMLVYDIDDGTSIEAWRCFSDYFVMVHTSYSHKPNFNKYRVIIPLKNPINCKEWKRAHIAAMDHWVNKVGVGTPDMKAIKDVSRVYYRYSIPNSDKSINSPLHPQNYHKSNYHKGELFDLKYDHIELPKKKVIKPIERKRSSSSVDYADLFTDSNFRFQVASKLGAKITGNAAKGINCPNCNRPDVVFSIDLNMPNAIRWPKCNHVESCKWWGGFEDLIGGIL